MVGARKALVRVLGLMGALATASACDHDNNIIRPVVTVAVSAFRDTSFLFRTLRTFSMPDTVVQRIPITGAAAPVTRQFDRPALDEVRADLLARGYIEVTDPDVQPDFIVLVSATATNGFNPFSGYPWFPVWGFAESWRWYTPGFSNAWGIIYPWASPSDIREFDEATLIVEIIPTSSVNAGTKTIRVVWAGVAANVLNGSFSAVTVTASIDKMFQLSPYLTAPIP